jgi:hypothetical protein
MQDTFVLSVCYWTSNPELTNGINETESHRVQYKQRCSRHV